MKLICIIFLFGFNLQSFATHVHGYHKKNGTYVQPHNRTHENQTQRDNYSSKPNVNPYTDKRGTKEPKK